MKKIIKGEIQTVKKLISVKLEPDLIDYLDKRAKKENRARNNLIETILLEEYKADKEVCAKAE